jgi:DNA-binding transcriptional MerR regulator
LIFILNLFQGLPFRILIALLLVFLVIPIFSEIIKKRKYKELLSDYKKEINLIIDNLTTGTESVETQLKFLKELIIEIEKIRTKYKIDVKNHNAKTERILKEANDFINNIEEKLRMMTPKNWDCRLPELRIDFFNKEQTSYTKINIITLDEKINTVTDQFKIYYDSFDQIFNFINIIFEKIIKLDQINKEFQVVFDNIKLLYLNIQLEAIKKGDIANEFIVIGNEMNQLYDDSRNNVNKVEEILNFIKTQQNLIETGGEIRINFENLSQDLTSLASDIKEIQKKMEANNINSEMKDKFYSDAETEYQEFIKKWYALQDNLTEIKEFIEKNNNRVNITVLEFKNALKWLEHIKEILKEK